MIFQLTVPQFTKMLTNLKNVLEKGRLYAETKKVDFDVFLNSRLAPDQFNLTRQIQIACDTAKLGAARLSGKTAPVDEDNETNLTQLLDRIDRVQTFLQTLVPFLHDNPNNVQSLQVFLSYIPEIYLPMN